MDGNWHDWTGPLAHWSRARKWLVSSAAILAALVGGIALEIHLHGAYFFVVCDLNRLEAHGPGRSSVLYSADGVRFATIGALVVHTAVPLSRIDPKLRKATVAIEDRRFFHEGGTDWIAMVRAAAADVTSASLAQGGSTLTQQLVRNLYLGGERTLGRKLQEGCLADQLAHRWTKDHVLDAYLNTVFYGQQAYGVQAAAQTYFSTSAARLTLPQAALIAGLPQAPTQYDPLRNPSDARARRQEVLKAMLSNGDIDEAAYRQAVDAPLGLKPSPIGRQQPESFFVNYPVRAARRSLRRGDGAAGRAPSCTRRSFGAGSERQSGRSRRRSTGTAIPRRPSSRSTRATERSERWPPWSPASRASRTTSPYRAGGGRAPAASSSSSPTQSSAASTPRRQRISPPRSAGVRATRT